jgi:hypothetical protein
MIFLHTSCPNSNRPVFGLKEFYGLKKLNCEIKEMGKKNLNIHQVAILKLSLGI